MEAGCKGGVDLAGGSGEPGCRNQGADIQGGKKRRGKRMNLFYISFGIKNKLMPFID
jgi:hypothetical protein